MAKPTFPRTLAFAALLALVSSSALAVDAPMPPKTGGDPTSEPDKNVDRNQNAATTDTTGSTPKLRPTLPGSDTPVTQPEGGIGSNTSVTEPEGRAIGKNELAPPP